MNRRRHLHRIVASFAALFLVVACGTANHPSVGVPVVDEESETSPLFTARPDEFLLDHSVLDDARTLACRDPRSTACLSFRECFDNLPSPCSSRIVHPYRSAPGLLEYDYFLRDVLERQGTEQGDAAAFRHVGVNLLAFDLDDRSVHAWRSITWACRSGDEAACEILLRVVPWPTDPAPFAAASADLVAGCRGGDPDACATAAIWHLKGLAPLPDGEDPMGWLRDACLRDAPWICHQWATWTDQVEPSGQDWALATSVLETQCDRGYLPSCTTFALRIGMSTGPGHGADAALNRLRFACDRGASHACYLQFLVKKSARDPSGQVDANDMDRLFQWCSEGVTFACRDADQYLRDHLPGPARLVTRVVVARFAQMAGSGELMLHLIAETIGSDASVAEGEKLRDSAIAHGLFRGCVFGTMDACELMVRWGSLRPDVDEPSMGYLDRVADHACNAGRTSACYHALFVAQMVPERLDSVRTSVETLRRQCEADDLEACLIVGVLFGSEGSMFEDPILSTTTLDSACQRGSLAACGAAIQQRIERGESVGDDDTRVLVDLCIGGHEGFCSWTAFYATAGAIDPHATSESLDAWAELGCASDLETGCVALAWRKEDQGRCVDGCLQEYKAACDIRLDWACARALELAAPRVEGTDLDPFLLPVELGCRAGRVEDCVLHARVAAMSRVSSPPVWRSVLPDHCTAGNADACRAQDLLSIRSIDDVAQARQNFAALVSSCAVGNDDGCERGTLVALDDDLQRFDLAPLADALVARCEADAPGACLRLDTVTRLRGTDPAPPLRRWRSRPPACDASQTLCRAWVALLGESEDPDDAARIATMLAELCSDRDPAICVRRLTPRRSPPGSAPPRRLGPR